MKINIYKSIFGVLIVIFGAVSILTSSILYQRRTEPVAPNAPRQSFASQQFVPDITESTCDLSFSIVLAEATDTPEATEKPIGGAPEVTPVPTAPTDSSTTAPTSAPTTTTSTPSPTRIAQASPTSTPVITELPDSGVGTPAIIGVTVSILLIIGAAVLAF